MGSPCDVVMNIPELVHRIIAFIDTPRAMARAARINSAWHEEAIRYLWRGAFHIQYDHGTFFEYWHTPSLQVLCAIARRPGRFHHYLKHTRHLYLWEEGLLANGWLSSEARNGPRAWIILESRLWTSLSFISVKIGHIDPLDLETERNITHLLKPTLRGLELGNMLPTAQLMARIKTNATALRWLQFEAQFRYPERADPRSIINSLQDMRHLTAIEMGYPANHDLQMAILQRRDLTVLHIDGNYHIPDRYTFPDALANCNSTLSIRELRLDHLYASGETYRFSLPRFLNVEVLEIYLTNHERERPPDISKDILTSLLGCKRLRKLRIEESSVHPAIAGNAQPTLHSITGSALHELCNACRHLERLHLCFSRKCTPLEPTILPQLATCLPRLQFLELKYPVDCTGADVGTLAEDCSDLKLLEGYIFGRSRILQGMPVGAKFTRVESFICTHMTKTDLTNPSGAPLDRRVKHFINLVSLRMPKLRRLWVPEWFRQIVLDKNIDVGWDLLTAHTVTGHRMRSADPYDGFPDLGIDQPEYDMKREILEGR